MVRRRTTLTHSKWIVFTYRVPTETSTLRVRAWRILRRIGALSLQQSACVAPNAPLVERKLRHLQALIEEAGGEAQWLDVERSSPETEANLISQFNERRAEEYAALLDECSLLESRLYRYARERSSGDMRALCSEDVSEDDGSISEKPDGEEPDHDTVGTEGTDAEPSDLQASHLEAAFRHLQKVFRKLSTRDYFGCQSASMAAMRMAELEQVFERTVMIHQET